MSDDTPDLSARRVVLERRRVLCLPTDVDEDAIAQAVAAALRVSHADEVPFGDAWIVVAEHEATSKEAAIKLHTGDRIPGDFKAVPLRSWKGGVSMQPPPAALFVPTRLED